MQLDSAIRETLVPAGAAARLYASRGPGLPWFEDATPPFRAAIGQLEQGREADALPVILRDARPRDALTLLMLLRELPERDRGPLMTVSPCFSHPQQA